jgi:hypothetical protein
MLALLRRVPVAVWAGLAMFVFLVGFGAYAYRKGVTVERDRQERKAQAAAFAWAIERGAIEKKQRGELAQVAEDFRRANDAAIAERDTLIAELRGGSVRLRERFTCPPRVSRDSTAAAGSHEAPQGGLSGADAEFLIRLASEADEAAKQLTACQDTIRTYQR